MEDVKDKLFIIAWGVIAALALLLVLGAIILKIYALITYGDTPITEAPVWVVWILQDGGSTK